MVDLAQSSSSPDSSNNSELSRRPIRHTSGKRRGGRSARVVQSVLATTLEELGLHGYGGLRIEEIARRAGVNKTTIYRRWPNRNALVEAALRSLSESTETPDTGTLRGDLLADYQRTLEWLLSPLGKGLARMRQGEWANGSDVAEILNAMRNRSRARRLSILERGLARGELPAGTDLHLVVQVLHGAVFPSAVDRYAADVSTRAELERRVDLVLAGARAVSAQP